MARGRDKAPLLAPWLSALSLAGAVFCAPVPSTAGAPSSPATVAKQSAFQTADQAVEALIAANRADKLQALARILGPDGMKLIHSGDPVDDHNHRARFVADYDESHRIEFDGADKAVLVVGKNNWPLPIPLIRTRSGWRFDTVAGEREILDRRIGRNELNVIKVCRAYVEAQREYAAMNNSPPSRPAYAKHFMSHEGQHDGLYWPTRADEKESPLGPLVAQARAQGYPAEPAEGKLQPYHGYYFRILTRQGANAPGGARDYIVDGHMTGGFALLAYPAGYGDSGIMTFIVNQDGIVFERNLGPQTEALAQHIEQYDPDRNWRAP